MGYLIVDNVIEQARVTVVRGIRDVETSENLNCSSVLSENGVINSVVRFETVFVDVSAFTAQVVAFVVANGKLSGVKVSLLTQLSEIVTTLLPRRNSCCANKVEHCIGNRPTTCRETCAP